MQAASLWQHPQRHTCQESVSMVCNGIQREGVLSQVAPFPICFREQTAEIRIPLAACRPYNQWSGLNWFERCPNQQLESNTLGGTVSSHDSGKRSPIGDGQRGIAKRACLLH